MKARDLFTGRTLGSKVLVAVLATVLTVVTEALMVSLLCFGGVRSEGLRLNPLLVQVSPPCRRRPRRFSRGGRGA